MKKKKTDTKMTRKKNIYIYISVQNHCEQKESAAANQSAVRGVAKTLPF